jgi:hypothetical protein
MWVTIFLHSLEWRNIVTHGQLKENLYFSHYYGVLTLLSQWWKNL